LTGGQRELLCERARALKQAAARAPPDRDDDPARLHACKKTTTDNNEILPQRNFTQIAFSSLKDEALVG
jgi:hypothetical protein